MIILPVFIPLPDKDISKTDSSIILILKMKARYKLLFVNWSYFHKLLHWVLRYIRLSTFLDVTRTFSLMRWLCRYSNNVSLNAKSMERSRTSLIHLIGVIWETYSLEDPSDNNNIEGLTDISHLCYPQI